MNDCYKLVSQVDGRFLSAMFSKKHFTVEYFTDRENFPVMAGTPLFAFSNLYDAENFAYDIAFHNMLNDRFDGQVIFEASYSSIFETSRDTTGRFSMTSKQLVKFWSTPTKGRMSSFYAFPRGTLLVRSIFLNKIVWRSPRFYECTRRNHD